MQQAADRDEPAHTHVRTFDRELEGLEAAVLAQAERVTAILGATVGRLESDTVNSAAVDAEDDEVDDAYAAIEHDAVLLIARRQPVAGDLRRILALLRTALHLERISDGAVDIAGFLAADGPVPSARLLEILTGMTRTAVAMTDTALRALTTQDTELALEVEHIDDELDRQQVEAFELITANAADREQLAGLLATDRIARALERAGDHAVDIAEEAWFLTTGESREFGKPHGAR